MDIGELGTARPYGTWLVLYREWLHYFETTWPIIEETFHGRMEGDETLFERRWATFISHWLEQRQAIVETWLDYPIWPDRGPWLDLMASMTDHVQRSRLWFSGLLDPDLFVFEVWPDLQKWSTAFRPWLQELEAWNPVLSAMQGSRPKTAAWQRWLEALLQPTVQAESATAPLYAIRQRIRLLGRDWSPSSRFGWNRWLDIAIPWTFTWYRTWERWLNLPWFS